MSWRHESGIDLAANKLDAVLITGVENVRYLSGFTGSNGIVLLRRDREPLFFTDPRYTIQSAQEVSCRTKVIPRRSLLVGIAAELKKVKTARVGFEKSHVTFDLHEKLK